VTPAAKRSATWSATIWAVSAQAIIAHGRPARFTASAYSGGSLSGPSSPQLGDVAAIPGPFGVIVVAVPARDRRRALPDQAVVAGVGDQAGHRHHPRKSSLDFVMKHSMPCAASRVATGRDGAAVLASSRSARLASGERRSGVLISPRARVGPAASWRAADSASAVRSFPERPG
jgi:hypothetical protein